MRELNEETGLSTRVVRPLGIVTLASEGFSYRIHEFLVAACEENAPLRAGDDAADARWVDRLEFASLGLSDEVVRLVDRAIDDGFETR